MPARTSFMDGTIISEVAESESGYNYYGYVRVDGSWIIQREATSAPITHRYAMGKNSFSTNWSNRSGLTYLTVEQISAKLPFGSW